MNKEKFERKWLKQLLSQIEVGEGYFLKTDDSIVFTYQFDGRIRFLTIEEKHNVADFLFHNGIIDNHTGTCSNTRMYRNVLVTTINKRNEVVGFHKNVEVHWQEIEFTPEQAKFFCAKNELEKLYLQMGYQQAAVIKLFTYIHKMIA